MGKEICKICGEEFNNLGSHLNKKHSMTRQEYEISLVDDSSDASDDEETVTEVSEDISDIPEEIIKDSITGKDLTKHRLGVEEDKISLKEYCSKNDITEQELRKLVKQYKGESTVPVTQIIKTKVDNGTKSASKLAEEYERGELKVSDLYIAEALVKNYGFTCDRIDRKPSKMWVLRK